MLGHGVSINEQAKTVILNVCDYFKKLKLKIKAFQKPLKQQDSPAIPQHKIYAIHQGLSLLIIFKKMQFEGK